MADKRGKPMQIGKKKVTQVLVFVAVLGYFIFTFFLLQPKVNETKEQYNQALERLEAAKQENAELQKEYASIGTDEFYEKVAREVFGYVKPGEKIFYESKN